MNNKLLIVGAILGFVLSLYCEYCFINATAENIVYAVNLAWSVLYVYLVIYILNNKDKGNGGGKKSKEIINNTIYGYLAYCTYIFLMLIITEIMKLPTSIENEFYFVSLVLFLLFVIIYPVVIAIIILKKN